MLQGSALGHLGALFALVATDHRTGHPWVASSISRDMLEPLHMALAACLEEQPAGMDITFAETALNEGLADGLLPASQPDHQPPGKDTGITSCPQSLEQ